MDAAPRTARRDALMVGAAMLGWVALALHLGPSSNWDLRNYHLYAPYAWLEGRLDVDVAPAQVQTFFNPLLHVPLFFAARAVDPWAVTALVALLQALNLPLLVAIARRISGHAGLAVPFACAIAGMLGAVAFGQIGASFGDTVVTVPFLASLALLLDGRTWTHAPRLALAGALLGAAVGLKLAFAPVATGLVLALPWFAPAGTARVRAIAVVGSAAFAAFLATAGPWMWEMWTRHGNPVFPMFADLFGAAAGPPFDTRDHRFAVTGVVDALTLPYQGVADYRRVSDVRFRDLRIPLLLALAVAAPLWLRRVEAARRAPLRALAVAFLAGYALWAFLFGYWRYLVAWELLAPAVAVAAFPGARRGAAFALLAVLVLTTRAQDYGRIDGDARSLLAVEWPVDVPRDAVVVMAGGEPLAWLALALPPEVPVVRASSNVHGGDWPPWALDRAAADRLDAHAGPVFALHQERDAAATDTALARLGLVLDRATCRPVLGALQPPREAPPSVCSARRTSTASAALDAVVARWRGWCTPRAIADPQWQRICATVGVP